MKKTIKIIDLLNKIANGEEVPKEIRWRNHKYIQRSDVEWYISKNGNFDDTLPIRTIFLNDEVEMISDEEEFEDIESFGIHYSWDYIDYKNIEELKKYVNKDFQNIFDTLDKLIKNQKKIIEKLSKNNNAQ